MNLTVSGHHVAVTPALRGYLHNKLARMTRHFDRVIEVNVILGVEKLRQRAEVTVRLRGKDIYAQTEHEDLYAAIDALADKIDRQVLRHKDRLRSRAHHSAKHAGGASPPEPL